MLNQNINLSGYRSSVLRRINPAKDANRFTTTSGRWLYRPEAMAEDQEKPSDAGEELFQIIDETGEGWGFDLDPQTVAKPVAIATGTLFGLGMLAGIPAGLVVGRNQVGSEGGKKVKPSMAGFLFAARSFLCGTMLCGAMGTAGFYGLKWYYEADSFEEFGRVMREEVPRGRLKIEQGLGPVISRIRSGASDSLPGPLERMREKFQTSRTGLWVRSHFELNDRLATANEDMPKSNSETAKQ